MGRDGVTWKRGPVHRQYPQPLPREQHRGGRTGYPGPHHDDVVSATHTVSLCLCPRPPCTQESRARAPAVAPQVRQTDHGDDNAITPGHLIAPSLVRPQDHLALTES